MKHLYFGLTAVILLCMTSLYTNSQDVFIPDPIFKAALVGDPSINTNMDGEIQYSEASAYSWGIGVSGLGITNMTGIEAFTNIFALDCSYNSISFLDLTSNTSLQDVSCNDNNLTFLNVYMHPSLSYLDCTNNSLMGLDVTDCYNLWGLACGNNNINGVVAQGCTSLQYFDCYNNGMTSLVLPPQWLEVINAQDNNFTNLTIPGAGYLMFSNNPDLTSLICTSYGIGCGGTYEIAIDGCNALETLHISGQCFPSLDVSHCSNLTSLRCSNNEFTSIDVSSNTLLTELKVDSLDLTTLDISSNPNLELLSCSYNNLTELDISTAPMLTQLNCGHNQISELDVSSSLLLTDLECYENELTEVNLYYHTDLNYLDCSNNYIAELHLFNNPALQYVYCQYNYLELLDIRNGNNGIINNFNATNNPFLVCIEVDDDAYSSSHPNWLEGPFTFYGPDCQPGSATNTISGYVLSDSDCVVDGDEPGIEGIIVYTNPPGYYGITDINGFYTIMVDSGTYEVMQMLPNYPGVTLDTICPVPNYHTIDFNGVYLDTSNINFHNDVIVCPLLTVDLNSTARRACFHSNTTINYCNQGYGNALSAYVNLQLPEYVHLISADVPYTTDPFGNYVFDVGDLMPGECGTINIVDSVSCNPGLLGIDQCIEVWMTPPNDCFYEADTAAMNSWDRSSVEVRGECIGDTLIQFVIFNTGDLGDGDMMIPSEYRIYENDMLAYTGSFQLLGQDSIIIEIEANGNTIRCEADQHPMHPGYSFPQETIVGCGNSGLPLVPGMVNIFAMDDENYEIEIDCMPITGSYDPNDKAVSPVGLTTNNILPQGSLLDYRIRFQNTGNDTAFNVIVLDTLSQHLDITTIEIGASSHPYEFTVVGDDLPVLRFAFIDILLPDSTTNEPDSHGYINFKIAPFDSIPQATIIHNQADIYFDYNDPIITNDAFVMIADTVIGGSTIVFNMHEYYNDTLTMCEGDSVEIGGIYYYTEGDYDENNTNSFGCDSNYVVNLIVYPMPDTDAIFGEDTVEVDDIEIYTISPDTLIYYWDVDLGTIITQISNTEAEIQWDTPGYGYVYVVAENSYGCLSDTVVFEVLIGTTDLTDIISNNEIIIYPNPVSNLLNVESEIPVHIEIYSLNGKKVISSSESIIDVSVLYPSVYLLMIKDKDGVLIKMEKIVVQ